MFTFTALHGTQSTSSASQSIIELDGGVKILVDVGWDERFDPHQVSELEKHVSTLSLVLLTHATISHLGAFAYCCKHIPLFSQVPVYATPPVISFGRTLLQDLYKSNPLAATFIPDSTAGELSLPNSSVNHPTILREPPTFDEINRYFSIVTPLKYSQPHQPTASYFSAPLDGLTLTAYNAGHTLGGTIWHIQHGMESIVYAVDWHQARENVIAGAAWFGGVGGSEVIEQLRKPTALICSSTNGDKIAMSGGRRARDEILLSHVQSSLAKEGTVLIPTDSSARMLELAWLLEKSWDEAKPNGPLKNANVYLASRSAHTTLRHARSLLEWMDDSIVREFEGDDVFFPKAQRRTENKQMNGNGKSSRPFEFQHIKIVEHSSKLEKLLKSPGPKVFIASDTTLDWGFSKQVFEHVAQKSENLIILTDRSDAGHNVGADSIQQRLWHWYRERQDGVALETTLNGQQLEQVHSDGRPMLFRSGQVSELDPNETQKYQQYMATQRQVQASLLTSDNRQLVEAEEAMDDDDDDSSSESDQSDNEQQGRALNASAALGHSSRNKVALSDEELGVSILLRKKGVHDYDVRHKKGRNALFPHIHSKKRGDEFGEFIKPEDFLREEEKEEISELDKKGNSMGQKRKWDDTLGSKADTATKKSQKGHFTGAEEDENGDSDSSGDESLSENNESRQWNDKMVPQKVVFVESSINLNARLAFVDFAGLHDQRSLQMLIPLIGPKKLIFVKGSSKEVLALAADCKELLGMKVDGAEEEVVTEIFTPLEGQTIDASVDTNAWVVKLSRDLSRRLQWQNVKNVGIVTITGQLKAEVTNAHEIPRPSQPKKQKLEDETKQSQEAGKEKSLFEPVLEPIPANVATSSRTASQTVHVGDLRLADLRRLLNASGHAAEFRGEGILVVDGMIAVRKQIGGKIVVEGTPVSSLVGVSVRGSDSFTQVKRKIYEGLAVVGAA